MAIRDTVITMLIMSAFLALWELLFRPAIFEHVKTEGVFGFGTVMLMYFIVMLVGFVIARIFTRRKKQVVVVE